MDKLLNTTISLSDPSQADVDISAIKGNDIAVSFESDGFELPRVVVNGAKIAVVPVHGSLEHREQSHYNGYFTGYDFISNAVRRADIDPSVDGIVLDVSSGGGSVNGAFECGDIIKSLTKPTCAIVNASAYSGGYLLASSCDSIYLPITGGVGSIGVRAVHIDKSKMIEDLGYKVTMIYVGEHKVDGNQFESLRSDVKERILVRLKDSYKLFVDFIASSGRMTKEDVESTKAGIYQGQKALEVGLVDYVMSPEKALEHFAATLIKSSSGGISMSEEKTEVIDAKQISIDSKNEERARIGAITSSEESKGREVLANYLAMSTDMSADEAIAILKHSPIKEEVAVKKQEASVSVFDAAMSSSGNPEVGSSMTSTGGEKMSSEDEANLILKLM